MAKKTFTVDAIGNTDGQALDTSPSAIIVRGNLKGGDLDIQASDTDGNYALAVSAIDVIPDAVIAIQPLPAGWYVRTRFVGDTAPDATVVIE